MKAGGLVKLFRMIPFAAALMVAIATIAVEPRLAAQKPTTTTTQKPKPVAKKPDPKKDAKVEIYLAQPFDAEAAPAAPVPAPASAKKAGVIEYLTTSTDAGDTKEMFGLTARHVTTVVTRTPSPDACDKKKDRVQTDGWYAAMPVVLTCAPPAPQPETPASDCHDQHKSSSVGGPPAGAPLGYTTTTYGDDGKQVASMQMKVTALTVAPIGAAQLDAPAGYAKAADGKAFLTAVERAADEERWRAAKAAGVTRIGVAMPVNKTDQRDVSLDAVNTDLLEGLTSAPFEAIPLTATSPADEESEARARGCDYVIALEVASLKTTTPGKVGGMIRKASGGGSPTELHEVKVEYRVFAPGSGRRAEGSGREEVAGALAGWGDSRG
jgi:hypothetical protein